MRKNSVLEKTVKKSVRIQDKDEPVDIVTSDNLDQLPRYTPVLNDQSDDNRDDAFDTGSNSKKRPSIEAITTKSKSLSQNGYTGL